MEVKEEVKEVPVRRLKVATLGEDVVQFRRAFEKVKPAMTSLYKALNGDVKDIKDFIRLSHETQTITSNCYANLQRLHSSVMHDYSPENAVDCLSKTGEKIEPNYTIVNSAKEFRKAMEIEVAEFVDFVSKVLTKKLASAGEGRGKIDPLREVCYILMNDLEILTENLIVKLHDMLGCLLSAVFLIEDEKERVAAQHKTLATMFPDLLSAGRERRRTHAVPSTPHKPKPIEVLPADGTAPGGGPVQVQEGPPKPQSENKRKLAEEIRHKERELRRKKRCVAQPTDL
jgi:hypothetical protein